MRLFFICACAVAVYADLYHENTLQNAGPINIQFQLFLRHDIFVQDVTEDRVIPLEKSKADLLLIAGEDDHNSDSVR